MLHLIPVLHGFFKKIIGWFFRKFGISSKIYFHATFTIWVSNEMYGQEDSQNDQNFWIVGENFWKWSKIAFLGNFVVFWKFRERSNGGYFIEVIFWEILTISFIGGQRGGSPLSFFMTPLEFHFDPPPRKCFYDPLEILFPRQIFM